MNVELSKPERCTATRSAHRVGRLDDLGTGRDRRPAATGRGRRAAPPTVRGRGSSPRRPGSAGWRSRGAGRRTPRSRAGSSRQTWATCSPRSGSRSWPGRTVKRPRTPSTSPTASSASPSHQPTKASSWIAASSRRRCQPRSPWCRPAATRSGCGHVGHRRAAARRPSARSWVRHSITVATARPGPSRRRRRRRRRWKTKPSRCERLGAEVGRVRELGGERAHGELEELGRDHERRRAVQLPGQGLHELAVRGRRGAAHVVRRPTARRSRRGRWPRPSSRPATAIGKYWSPRPTRPPR